MNESGAGSRAVILLSGGLDSATVLALAREAGLECFALTVRYGQRHLHEVDCARRVAESLGVKEHKILDLDLRAFGGSALLAGGPLPPNPALEPGGRHRSSPSPSIPATYVPARNTILLSLGLAWAEVLPAGAIFFGANSLDYSGYPDCRPEYVEAFQRLARVATRCGVEGHPIEIRAPLLALSKAQIVAEGSRLGVDFSLTSSCYDPRPDGSPCGACDSCLLRARGFAEAGAVDPLAQARGGKPGGSRAR